jgi:hypothetical protein
MPKQGPMLKNLYRLRLLDFFELTAATAGALYVWKYTHWYEAEKSWVLGAVSIAALFVWLATRIGNGSPTPGIFIAAYSAALYGLCDISPWMIALGSPRMLALQHKLYPTHLHIVKDQSWLLDIRLGLTITVLMLTPAILVGCTWSCLGAAIQIARKTYEAPKRAIGWAPLIFRGVIALLLVSLLGMASMRPTVRHLQTIRLSHSIEVPNPAHPGQSTRLIPSPICAWSLLEDERALILKLDGDLLEVDLASGQVVRHLLLQADRNLELPKLSSNESTHGRVDSIIRMRKFGENQLLLLRTSGRANSLTYRVFDLATGKETPGRRPAFRDQEAVMSLSPNCRYLVTLLQGAGAGPESKFRVWDLDTCQPLREFNLTRPPSGVIYGTLGINEPGDKIQFVSRSKESEIWNRIIITYIDELILEPPAPLISNDGKWCVYDGQFVDLETQKNILSDCAMTYPQVMTFHERKNMGVIMQACNKPIEIDALGEPIEGGLAFGETPLIDRLFKSAFNRQIALFDPVSQRMYSTFVNRGLLNRPKLWSAKFTKDGRKMIVPDEDASADLFHIFSMP